MSLTILYRGSLSSCNYACSYCPFAKQQSTREQLAQDKADLERFVSWVKNQTQQEISILFTPWGEALIRGYYRDALATLSSVPQVKKVAIQTNFSCSTQWLETLKDEHKNKLAFWITYHPTEISGTDFLKKCQALDRLNIQYSVGTVGVKAHFDAIKTCRDNLNPKRYLWINAYKREDNYYQKEDLAMLQAIDPHFAINNQKYPSLDKDCNTGKSVISIDGNGDVQRCHFIKKKLGNIYQQQLTSILKTSPCSNDDCSCYIGYIHMPDLALETVYGDKILERIALEF